MVLPASMPTLAELCLYLVAGVGALALVALLVLFVVFLWKAGRALRLSKPAANCPKCGHPLPAIPSTAIVQDDGTSFLFSCAACQHKVAIRAAQDQSKDT